MAYPSTPSARRARAAAARRIQRKFRARRMYSNTRGTGRGYRPGYSRFGRVSAPELKHQVLARESTIVEGAPSTVNLPPTIIAQGVGETNRIGNRINAKFLNTKVLFTSRQSEPAQGNYQQGNIVRYVLWSCKDPAGAIPPTWADPLTLTSFINTKRFRIHKTGYVSFPALGGSKVLRLNYKCRNMVMSFADNTDGSVDTTKRYYLTMACKRDIDFEIQSKFYFADP